MAFRITGLDARPIITNAQMVELRRLGFRGPVAYLMQWEASREITRLRKARQDEAQAGNRFAVGTGRVAR